MAPVTTNKTMLILGGLAAVGLGLYLYQRRNGKSLSGYQTAPSTSVVPKFHRSTPIVSELKTNGMKVQHRRSASMPIEERVANIQDMVWESIQDPAMRKLALAITRKCKERDEICEAKAIYDAVKDRVRYTGDIAPVKIGGRHGPVEPVDLYQSARRTWEFGGGDCDDHSILLATLLTLNGITARVRVTAEEPQGEDSHIYPLAIIAGSHSKTDPKKWTSLPLTLSLDSTLPGRNFGREHAFGRKKDFAIRDYPV